jgi:nucleoside-diphosphate-sugar epimerase
LTRIQEIMESDVTIVTDEQRLRPWKSEVFRLVGDDSFIGSATGWHPEHTLEEGLRETVTWFRNPENLKKYKADIYNL